MMFKIITNQKVSPGPAHLILYLLVSGTRPGHGYGYR